MPLETRKQRGYVIMAVSGRLTLGREVEQLENAVTQELQEGGTKFVLDLADLDYADSSGIGSMVACLTRIKQAGGELRVAGVNPRLARMFKMTGVDRLFPIFRNAGEAAAG